MHWVLSPSQTRPSQQSSTMHDSPGSAHRIISAHAAGSLASLVPYCLVSERTVLQ